jgi:predicted secreted hydrolase
VTGHGWLDREWSSQPMTETQTGWDWFSLSSRHGREGHGLPPLRSDIGPEFTAATWIDRGRHAQPYPDGA